MTAKKKLDEIKRFKEEFWKLEGEINEDAYLLDKWMTRKLRAFAKEAFWCERESANSCVAEKFKEKFGVWPWRKNHERA